MVKLFSYLLSLRVESRENFEPSCMHPIKSERHLGVSPLETAAARGVPLWFKFYNTLTSNLGQCKWWLQLFHGNPQYLGGRGRKKRIRPPTHTSKGRSFILSIKAHYSTMIKAAAWWVAQSCWRNWNLGFHLLDFRYPGSVSCLRCVLTGAWCIY